VEPQFVFSDSESIPWIKSEIAEGVEVKVLCSANNQTMALYRFAPNTPYPDHLHEGPEFVYLLEGSCCQNGKWIEVDCSSAAETGTIDKGFVSGEKGCTFLTVYTSSKYI